MSRMLRAMPRSLPLLVVFASACAHDPAPPASHSSEGTLPAPIDVCVRVDGADPQPGHAIPSRAGLYDPAAPIDPTLLNWMAAGFGCVAYPSPTTPHARCDAGPERPLVPTVLCQQ